MYESINKNDTQLQLEFAVIVISVLVDDLVLADMNSVKIAYVAIHTVIVLVIYLWMKPCCCKWTSFKVFSQKNFYAFCSVIILSKKRDSVVIINRNFDSYNKLKRSINKIIIDHG